MKLMWFHLMPYTELLPVFRDKLPSVWVDIHSSLFDQRRTHHMYNDFMDELEYAAECGFDAVCVNAAYLRKWRFRAQSAPITTTSPSDKAASSWTLPRPLVSWQPQRRPPMPDHTPIGRDSLAIDIARWFATERLAPATVARE